MWFDGVKRYHHRVPLNDSGKNKKKSVKEKKEYESFVMECCLEKRKKNTSGGIQLSIFESD